MGGFGSLWGVGRMMGVDDEEKTRKVKVGGTLW